MSTLALLVVVALLAAAAALVVAGVVAAKFRKVWRALRSLHTRFAALEQTRGDARREINKCALRVAELEARAGIAPPSVHHDLRKVRPVEFDEDEANDAAAAETELPPPPRVPRLGDRVQCPAYGGSFVGEVSVIDHVGKKVSVKTLTGAVRNFKWEELSFVA